MNYHKLHESWNKFLKEEDLNEATEEEIEHISDILHDLKYDDLPFGNMFGETTRLIQPMKTKDKDLEKLKELFKDSGYVPDFTTGKATYYTLTFPPIKEGERPTTMILTIDQHEDLLKKGTRDNEEAVERYRKMVRKREIGIGKLLQKGSRLFDTAHKTQEEFEAVGPTDYPRDEYAKYRRKSMELEGKAEKDYRKLQDVFRTALPIGGKDVNRYKELADWWNKKSTFYRENPEAAKEGAISGEYSIVYSRHPIDVLRRSDFDAIESCHSPPSRSEGSAEYWRCAVAEAHGHGAIAYVVKNEDLKDVKEKYELEDATDQELLDAFDTNDEELFYDDKREEESGDIEPVSRVMIRQYGQPGLGIRLAVPEQAIYGDKNPAFHKQVVAWTKENQKEEIDKITMSPDAFDEGYLNLRKWERYGGSYQDTYDPEMFHGFLGFKTVGTATHDRTTEDSLEVHGNLIEVWQEEINDIEHRANNHYNNSHISATAEDDGADGVYINVRAHFTIRIDEDEFTHSAFQEQTRHAIEGVAENLREWGHDWLEDRVDYTVVRGEVHIDIPIFIEELNQANDSPYAYSPENFQEIANELKDRDSEADDLTRLARNHLKREGVLQGSALLVLNDALENESWHEWSYEVDDEWNPAEIVLQTDVDVNLNDLIEKISVEIDYAPGLGTTSTPYFWAWFDGGQIATVYPQIDDETEKLTGYYVTSSEFDDFTTKANMDEVRELLRWNIAQTILRPSRRSQGWGEDKDRSSREYQIAVSNLIRDALEEKPDEFAFPNRKMIVKGPDAEDKYRMMYTIHLTDDAPDEVVDNAHRIIAQTDDEDQLRDIFQTAFAQEAGINVTSTSIKEVKNYFSKYSFLLD